MNPKRILDKPFGFFIIVLSILTVLLTVSLSYLYSIRESSTLEVLKKEEELRSEIKFNTVKEELRSIKNDILLLEHLFKSKDINDQSEFTQLEKEFIFFAAAQRKYASIRYIDNEGNVKITVGFDGKNLRLERQLSDSSRANIQYFIDSKVLERGEIFVSRFELNIIDSSEGRPRRAITRYIIPAYNDKGKRLGIIVLHYMNNILVDKLLNLKSKTGSEFFILDINGNYILRPNDDNNIESEKNKLSMLAGNVLQIVNQEKQGQFLTKEGLYTFSKILPLSFVNESIDSSRFEYLKKSLPPREYSLVSFVSIEEINERVANFREDYIVFFIIIFVILSGFVLGLTILRKRRMALISANKKFRIFMESSLDSIVIVNSEGIITEVNPIAERMFCYSHDELVGKTIETLVPQPNQDHIKHRKDFMKNPKNVIINNYGKNLSGAKKGGVVFPVEISLSPVEIENEIFVMAVIRDISERKISEQKLRDSENKFRQIFNSANDIMFLQELGNNNMPELFVEVNEAAEKYLGYTKEEFLKLREQDLHRPEYLPELAIIHGNLLKDENIKFEIPYLRKDGTEVILEESSHVLTLDEKKYVLSIGRDITDKKMAEERLLESRQKLRELNEAKDRFFSIISHDLRSPFWAILGLSDILTDPEEDLSVEERTRIQENLNSALKAQYNLLDDLLKWSQIQMDRLEVETKQLILKSLVDRRIQELGRIAEQKELNIKNEVEKETVIITDENIISSVLRNLLSNAVKFTPRGGDVFIRAFDNKDFVSIEVEDTGMGMNADQLSKLFKIDTIFSTSGTEDEKGTGLGLILVKEMLSKVNGSIKIESEVNKGTKFSISIPKSESF